MNVRNVLSLTFIGHSLNHSLILLYPVVMIRLADLYPELSLAQFGVIGTVHYLLYGFMALPAGWLTDRLGARKVLFIYLAGAGSSAILLSFATTVTEVTLGLAILGTFCGLYHPAGLTLISHHSPTLSRHLGIHGIAGSLGLALGPLFGGLLASRYGWVAPYRMLGLVGLLAAALLVRYLPKEKPNWEVDHTQSSRQTRYKPLIYSYIIGAFMGLTHRGTLTFLPLHFSNLFADKLDPVLIGGLLTSLVLISGVAGQITGGRLGDAFPRHKIIAFVIALNIPSLIIITHAKGNWVVVVAIVWAVTNFMYQPIANAIIADNSSMRQRGTQFGILSGVSFGVGALASAIAGAIGDTWGTAAIFQAMALMLVPGVLAGLLLRRIDLPDTRR